MTVEKVEKILSVLRARLQTEKVPDDLTGSLLLNFQSGMVTGKIKMTVQMET
jgi:hypothetical protein